jgi:3-oxoacyl-[acyl-carrier protein] reductase
MNEPSTSDSALAGKVAVVTGAGRGIGRAIAIGYASAGAAVCACARSRDEIAQTAQLIEAKGGLAMTWTADVTDYASVTGLFLATQPSNGPTGQTFSLARREL